MTVNEPLTVLDSIFFVSWVSKLTEYEESFNKGKNIIKNKSIIKKIRIKTKQKDFTICLVQILMKLLVTGGLGFIGSNFILNIISKAHGISIINLDDQLFGSNELNLKTIEAY